MAYLWKSKKLEKKYKRIKQSIKYKCNFKELIESLNKLDLGDEEKLEKNLSENSYDLKLSNIDNELNEDESDIVDSS